MLSLIKRKLGVCKLCMKLSAIGALISLILYTVFYDFEILNALFAISLGFFATLFSLHIIAWAVRRWLNAKSVR